MKLFYTCEPTDSRAFLERILQAHYGISAPQFSETQNGKPFLADCPLRFNLSHSGSFTAAVFANQEIGLDIERRTPRNTQAITRRLSADEQNEDFFKVWTAKEAYIKYRGGTLAKMLSALEYRDGILYEKGVPVSAQLTFKELETCAVCICTAVHEPVTLIRL